MMRRRSITAPRVAVPQHLKVPLPQQFGLSAGFDVEGYLTAIKKRKDLREGVVMFVAFVIAFAASTYGFYLFVGDDDPIKFFWNPWVYLMPAVWAAYITMVITSWFTGQYEHLVGDPVEPSVRSYINAAVAYDTALRDWNDRQLETGQTYWREKRGVAFENAMKEFLARRGCSVDTTKGSGDGGIDLIAKLGGSIYWCQCKGHASPVGVAVVREIAGVCSRGGGAPVVIAVNGYTSAAVETANQLGVLLIDTHHLISLARQERISQW